MNINIRPILLNVGHAEPNGEWNWLNIRSPFARIYYVTRGSAKTVVDGEEYPLAPGKLYLTPPYTIHHDYSEGPFELYYIHFYFDRSEGLSVFDRLDVPVEVDAIDGDKELIERLKKINPFRQLSDIDPLRYDNQTSMEESAERTRRQTLHDKLETCGILCQLLARFLEFARPKPAQMDERVQRSIEYIHECLTAQISTDKLAEINWVTRDYMTRLFKRETGLSIVDYINREKMARAQWMLVATDKKVGDIASALAIHNVSYFNRLFLRQTGMTPSEYRESNMHP